jgi:hypothetical protein
MALTDVEKQEVRRYLGYLGVTLAASIQLGIPAASQPLFIVDSALNRLLPEAEPMVREHIEELKCIDEQIKDARRTRLQVSQVGEIKIRGGEELDLLYEEYDLWASRLSDILAAPINPFSELHQRVSGGGIRVIAPA